MVSKSIGTRDKILDAAERLFAARGYHGVSLRQITNSAKVTLALANYHFGPKSALFEAVLDRRAQQLNQMRLERLEECKARVESGEVELEDVIAAFADPMLEFCAHGGKKWRSYFALLAQVNNSPEWATKLMHHSFDPVIEVFIEAVREILPGSDAKGVYWSYHFLSGVLALNFANTGRLDVLSHGLCASSDWKEMRRFLIPYVASGMRAIADQKASNNSTATRQVRSNSVDAHIEVGKRKREKRLPAA